MKLRLSLCLVSFLCVSSLTYAEDPPNLGLNYGLSYIDNYSSCDAGCQLDSVDYADDQINQLDNALQNAGLTKEFKFGRASVYATDIIEDYYSGSDHIYGDNVDFYAITTHGNATTFNGNNIFYAAYCKRGSNAYNSSLDWDTDNCRITSNKLYLGEQTEMPNSLYSTNPGQLRWLVWSSCHSMDNALTTWINTFRYGMDYMLGYKDNASLGETTDEVLADFSNNIFIDNKKFESGWFTANDDWWVDNKAATFTCTDCSDTSSSSAQNRLTNYTRFWSKRVMTTSCSIQCSTSYHEG